MRPAVLFSSFLLLSTLFIPGGAGGPGRAAPSEHQRTEVLTDFSGMEMHNTTLRPDGGVELAISGDYSGMDELPLMIGDTLTAGPAAARNSRGLSIVCWAESSPSWHVWVQIYDSGWGKVGEKIDVSRYSWAIGQLAVAVGPDDRFALIWTQKLGADTSRDYDIFLRVFDANGYMADTVYDVVAVPGFQGDPSVAVDSQGRIVMAWADERNGNSDIFAQILDFDGATIGNIITVCNMAGYQGHPRLSLFLNDEFIVAWADQRYSETGPAVYARRFDQKGVPHGTEFRISSGTRLQYCPVVAAEPNGSFVVSWVAAEDSGNYTGMYLRYVRCFDAYANPVTAEFAVSLATDDYSTEACSAIVAYSDGGFILSWEESRNHHPGAIRAQRFHADASEDGSEMQVSTALTGQTCPTIFLDTDGNFTFIWNSNYGALARKFIHPHFSCGSLTTGRIEAGALWNWTDAQARVDYPDPAADDARLEFSTDGGADWTPLPDSGSLDAAGTAPRLRLRVTLTTPDWQTSPVLRTLTVRYVVDNLPWVNAGPDVSQSRKAPVNITAESGDDDGDPLTFRWTQIGGPAAADFDGSRPCLSFRSDKAGTYSFQVLVSDGFGDGAPAFLNVTLRKAAPQPRLNAAPLTQEIHQPVVLDASDSLGPESPIQAYYFDFGDGNRSGWQNRSNVSVSYRSPGEYSASVKVRDSEGDVAESAPVRIVILERLNRPPVIISTPVPYAQVGEEWSYEVSAFDADGDNLTYQLVKPPYWLSINRSTGRVSGVPPASQTGLHDVLVRVKDPNGGLADQSFVLNVTEILPSGLRPGCTISRPADGERVNGRVLVEGAASNGIRALLKVEIRVDGSEWTAVSGLRNWQFSLDTRKMENGDHSIEVRAFDGNLHSETAVAQFVVANQVDDLSIGSQGACATAMVMVVIVAVLTILLERRRRMGSGKPPEMGPE